MVPLEKLKAKEMKCPPKAHSFLGAELSSHVQCTVRAAWLPSAAVPHVAAEATVRDRVRSHLRREPLCPNLKVAFYTTLIFYVIEM